MKCSVISCEKRILSSCRKRSKKGDKGGKGLRHFSMKVCEKVQKKGVTSYNEVADELVAEFSDPRNISPSDQALVSHLLLTQSIANTFEYSDRIVFCRCNKTGGFVTAIVQSPSCTQLKEE